MSSILMCDSCGNIFSVNERGWQQYTKSIDMQGAPKNENGYGYPNMAQPGGISYQNAHNHGAATFHTCSTCALGEAPVIRPRAAMYELPTGRITTDAQDVEVFERGSD